MTSAAITHADPHRQTKKFKQGLLLIVTRIHSSARVQYVVRFAADPERVRFAEESTPAPLPKQKCLGSCFLLPSKQVAAAPCCNGEARLCQCSAMLQLCTLCDNTGQSRLRRTQVPCMLLLVLLTRADDLQPITCSAVCLAACDISRTCPLRLEIS